MKTSPTFNAAAQRKLGGKRVTALVRMTKTSVGVSTYAYGEYISLIPDVVPAYAGYIRWIPDKIDPLGLTCLAYALINDQDRVGPFSRSPWIVVKGWSGKGLCWEGQG